MKKWLGISGRRSAGKDTLCSMLVQNAAAIFPDGLEPVRVGFADPIKEILIGDFDVPPDVAYGDDAAKETHIIGNASMTVRQAAQLIGTAFRQVESTVWLRQARKTLADGFLVITPDVRFPDEVRAIQQAGGLVIRLTRSPIQGDSHVSETALDNFRDFDCVIDNVHMSVHAVFDQAVAFLQRKGWHRNS